MNGVTALTVRYFTKFVYDIIVKKSSRSLSHLLMSLLSKDGVGAYYCGRPYIVGA